MKALQHNFLILLLLVGGLASCEKDKTPLPTAPTKWDKICGQYSVYDSNGVFIYDMSISHIASINTFGGEVDSLLFQNLDGQFTFKQLQSNAINFPETFVEFGVHDPLKDTADNRWFFFSANSEFPNNVLLDDTLRLRFKIDNIQYYLSDLVPYYSGYKNQIAVKQ